ncbi:hypothetical protein ONS95_014103 [Cadophora gregata]|uniref:uncharacterized protein n=1 Tax=Cadophora gregata TaxID=51156 RepID=UPI0026DAC336|nr:uncharacterized protein ONS95_014103 [Cadophora gregata]KAK0113858.1 hypothetical protein ONS96_014709 [Cadophora gregata f. sp. sojae]KAK0114619.1 hypothetical protein ONS95_014103 [Cadophora gregata]
MAIGHGGKPKVAKSIGYLSDDSDFYGDDTTKNELEKRANAFDPEEWQQNKSTSLIELARKNMATYQPEQNPVTLYNPYEGNLHAKQLGESVDEFLARLPPATTPATEANPWIFLANPYRKVSKNKYSEAKLADEAPPNDGANLAEFVVRGNQLLEQLTVSRHDMEKKNPGKAKGTITKALNARRDEIVKELFDTAVKLHVTTGKWMIFPSPEEVDDVWSVVARATANNQLGISSKVAPDSGDDRKGRLICIYTENFKDMDDVRRVLLKLKDLGLVLKSKAIFYKCGKFALKFVIPTGH